MDQHSSDMVPAATSLFFKIVKCCSEILFAGTINISCDSLKETCAEDLSWFTAAHAGCRGGGRQLWGGGLIMTQVFMRS